MLDLLKEWFQLSLRVADASTNRIIWNLFLALIPLVLSLWLFRFSRLRSLFRLASPQTLLWWMTLIVFIIFLPNAPYILTDIIHYIRMIREDIPYTVVIFILTPQYFLFILAGFQCYVLSLLNLGYFLKRQGLKRWIVLSELSIHLVSAIGIYLGRFFRWNSWDVINELDKISDDLLASLSYWRPLVSITVLFAALMFLYWPMKQVNLGLVLRMQGLQPSGTESKR